MVAKLRTPKCFESTFQSNVKKYLFYLKSGTPAEVEMPAPHMMTIFLNVPSFRPKRKSELKNISISYFN